MTHTYVPVAEVRQERMEEPAFQAAYTTLEDELALASALIKARSEADMTQEQVAKTMGTTQAVVARLESGRVSPSTRTLERFARATHTRLRITFESKTGATEHGERIIQTTTPVTRLEHHPGKRKKA